MIYLQAMTANFYSTQAAISKDAIVDLSVKASADANPNKIVAVEGAALDDLGNLIVPEAIKWASQEIAANGLNTSYCPSIGLAGLADLILEETLGKLTLTKLKQQGVNHAGLVCSGGTNALSVPLAACASSEDRIIVQTPHWSGYDSIALALGHQPLLNFEFINESGNFNLEGLKETIDNAIKLSPKSKRLVIILNTPYDNPLAKEIKRSEWTELIKHLSETNKHRELTIILDTAYMDFGPGGKDYTRLNFLVELFESLEDRFNLVLATTLSKSFAMYGARIAASILLSKNKDIASKWTDIAGGIIRGTYSSASRPGQELALNILKDPVKLANIHQYQKNTVELVQKRQEHLFKLLNKIDFISDVQNDANTPLKYIRPDGVFFTGIRIEDQNLAQMLYTAMLADHIYVPIISNKYLRLPVCAMTEEFSEELLKRLTKTCHTCLAQR